MSYRLKLKEPLPAGLRRVALGQIEMATGKLRGTEDAATAVHDARRCLKRLRALLRLVRPGIDEELYQREAKRLAGIGRLLAGARDAHVMQQTLHHLESAHGALPEHGADRLVALITAPATADVKGLRDTRDAALGKLRIAQRLFEGPVLEAIDTAHVLEGMERVYRKARKAQRACRRETTDEAYHTWRKSVQQHWRHMQLLSRAWPDALEARADEAKNLAQLLGEDHDFAVLLAFAKARASDLPASVLETLEGQCRTSQTYRRTLADLRGERLFAEPARDLRERIGLYWESARKLAKVARQQPDVAAVEAGTDASKAGGKVLAAASDPSDG